VRQDPQRLSRQLGHAFADPQLLDDALTHRSAQARHNERLEFLGDAVLGFLVAERCGGASRMRRGRAEPPARPARQPASRWRASRRPLDLGQYLRLGAGELRSGGHARESILADAVEAVLAALYLDGGLEVARGVVDQLLGKRIAALSPADQGKDAKTRLQEWLQARRLALPVYEVLETSARTTPRPSSCAARSRRWADRRPPRDRTAARRSSSPAERLLETLDHD